MIAQDIKDLYFLANRYLVLPNTLMARIRFRKQRGLYLHLGCGDDYREGMVNVDGNIGKSTPCALSISHRMPAKDTVEPVIELAL